MGCNRYFSRVEPRKLFWNVHACFWPLLFDSFCFHFLPLFPWLIQPYHTDVLAFFQTLQSHSSLNHATTLASLAVWDIVSPFVFGFSSITHAHVFTHHLIRKTYLKTLHIKVHSCLSLLTSSCCAFILTTYHLMRGICIFDLLSVFPNGIYTPSDRGLHL